MTDPTTTAPETRTHPRRRMALIVTAVVIAAAVAAVIVYAVLPSTSSTGTQTGENNGTTTALTAHTSSGAEVTVPGSRPAGVLFFSVECGSCGPTARALAHTQAATPAAADFVAVDIAPTESESQVTGFLTDNNATGLAYAIDADGAWARRFNVTQLSTVVIVDTTGKEVFRAVEPTADQLQTALDKAAA